MQEVVLVIHLLLALTIIGLVLIQRSSGGGLGIGGSGGLGDFASARGAASALSKTTTICAFLFFATSLTLAIIAKHDTSGGGLLSQFETPSAEAPVMPAAPEGTPAEGTQSPVETMADPASAPDTPVTPEPPIQTQ